MPFEEESDFDGKSNLERRSEINGNNFGIEEESEIFSNASIMMDDVNILWSSADTKGPHSGFASPSASLSAGSSPSHAGSKRSIDISSNQVIKSGTNVELEKPLSDDVATDMVGTAVSSNEMELTKVLPTQSTNAVNYVDSISCASKSSKKKSGHIDERADFKSQFSKPAPVITNDVKPKFFGNSKPTGLDSVADDGEDDSELFKPKEVKSLSSNTPNGRPSSAIGGQSISHPKSAKIEAYHALPAKVGSIPSLPQNVRNGLKSSVRKVVQQFKASKESKPNLLDHGNEIGGKNNCKVVTKMIYLFLIG